MAQTQFQTEFLAHLDPIQVEKAQSFVTNFKVDHERIENMFEAINYSNEGKDVAAILQEINEKLITEQNQANSALKGKGGAVA